MYGTMCNANDQLNQYFTDLVWFNGMYIVSGFPLVLLENVKMKQRRQGWPKHCVCVCVIELATNSNYVIEWHHITVCGFCRVCVCVSESLRSVIFIRV